WSLASRRAMARLGHWTRAARAALSTDYRGLHVAHGPRVLARAQRAAGVALARDHFVLLLWRDVPVPHPNQRAGARAGLRPVSCQCVFERANPWVVPDTHRDRVHPARDGEGAHRPAPQDRRDDRSTHRVAQPPGLPG